MSAPEGESKDRYLTVTLVGEQSVRILCSDWPIIAQARSPGAGRDERLIVRRASDGRCLVIGIARPARGPQRRAGELVSTIAHEPPPEMIHDAIRRTAYAIGADSALANRCISAMPARPLR